MKKGQIWISAVLYMALGIVALTLILSAGVPLIQKMKDRNVVSQTKILMFSIDKNINAVLSEGPGSTRYLSPVEIRAGNFWIEPNKDIIRWQMKTTAKLLEPSIDSSGKPIKISGKEMKPFKEGNLNLFLQSSFVEDEYLMHLNLNYTKNANVSLESDTLPPFSGTYSMTISHTGKYSCNRGDKEITSGLDEGKCQKGAINYSPNRPVVKIEVK